MSSDESNSLDSQVAVTIELLGPVAIRMGTSSLMPSAGKPRQALTLLSLNCGRSVHTSALMEELWGDKIPRTGLATLQTYIMQLRRLITANLPTDLGIQSKDIIETTFFGYRLSIQPNRFDLTEFEKRVEEANCSLERGQLADASLLLRQGLDLWRGPVLGDVPVGRVLAPEAVRVEELRMRAQEQCIQVDLALGRHAAMVPELKRLVAQHPMNENLSALLMIALHRTGSEWPALQVYRDLRRVLSAELGIEPSVRLQNLHQAILSRSSELLLTAFTPDQLGYIPIGA
jgi:DNA-binding SARP family transcriptional activator